MIAKNNDVRKLSLSKETLRHLSSADLRRAAGGATTSTLNILCWISHQRPRP